MESSQYSYEAPGGSYESQKNDSDYLTSGDAEGPREPQRVPAFSPPAQDQPDGAPVPPPPPGPPPGPPAGPGVGIAPVPGPPPYPSPPAYPSYGGYPAYPPYHGGYGPPAGPPAYPYALPPLPAPRVVRHTLTRRTWVWVVALTALVSALVGGLVGAVVGAGSQQTIVQSFFPNRSVLVHPEDVQAVLARVEPTVVAINSQSGGAAGWGTSSRRPAPA